jgi:putative metalloprotease
LRQSSDWRIVFRSIEKTRYCRQGLVTAFDKFATMDAGHAKSLMDSHPASADRAEYMRERIAAVKK